MTVVHDRIRRVRQLAANPGSGSTIVRYTPSQKLYHNALLAAGVNPDTIQPSSERSHAQHPSMIAMQLIYAKCGPKDEGCEARSAAATGTIIRSAVVSYWRSRHMDEDYKDLGAGKFSGNPGRNKEISTLLDVLIRRQKECGSHIIKHAYQMTHEDVRTLVETYMEPYIHQAYIADPSFGLLEFAVATINCMQFTTLTRGDEMLRLDIEMLRFTGTAIDSPIVATLEYTKNNVRTKTTFTFIRGLHISICGLSALLRWLCILRKNGITSGPLFPQIVGNRPQVNERLQHGTYRTKLKDMCRRQGICENVGEHSARRGGAGYYYFVLRWDILAMFRSFKWKSFQHMLSYIGVEDKNNSYANAGFTALGTSELRYGA